MFINGDYNLYPKVIGKREDFTPKLRCFYKNIIVFAVISSKA